jgi:quercetin dioxygenase-like cupin family protein
MPTTTYQPIRLGPISVTFLVDAEASGGSVTVSRCDVLAGGGMPVAHSHDAFEETIYGLAGTVTLTVDGADIPVGPGEAFCIPRGAVHSFMAHNGDVSFLAVATPGVFGPDYFLELAAVLDAAAGGPPDPAAVAAVMLRHGLTPARHPVA